MITPKRTIHANVKIERERRLPVSGKSFVKEGDQVHFDSDLLSAEIKGEIYIIRLADKLGIDSDTIHDGLKIKIGDSINSGDLIFYRKGFFKFLTLEEYSPVSGSVEFISVESGNIGVRLAATNLIVKAFFPGQVKGIYKNRAVTLSSHVGLLQGVVGYGEEAIGKIVFADVGKNRPLTKEFFKDVKSSQDPLIIVGGQTFSEDFFDFAKQNKVVGIVTSSIRSEIVKGVLKTSVLGTSPKYEHKLPTVIIVEGFGDIELSQIAENFFKDADGKLASINGLTQVRAGAIRPELIIHEPLTSYPETTEVLSIYPKIGDSMRIVRGRHFGKIGQIVEIPSSPQILDSGIESHIAILKVGNDGVSVSFANLENL